MIPCLYAAGETAFTTNGLGKLTDCTECKVTEKRNGEYELAMSYPANGIHADEIEMDCFVLAKPNENGSSQPFRIYSIEYDISGNLTVAAEHISYMLNYITISPVSVLSGTSSQPTLALTALKKAATTDCPFTFETDITSTSYFSMLSPVTLRSALGGVEGSMIDTYGGEFEWDLYNVILHKSRGADNGVRITYGKNLTEYKKTADQADTITGVHPYWTDDDGDVMELSEKVVTLSSGVESAYEKIALLDCKDQFDEQPSEASMRSYAQNYLTSTTDTETDVDIDISFAALWQTEEYKDIAEAESVSLCDTVHVYMARTGETIKMKVTETVYDTLLERYDSIVLSNSTTSSRNKELSLTVATTSAAKAMIALTDSAIRLSVTKHLENYSTTEDVESMISVTEDAITLAYTTKFSDYSTTVETTSLIEAAEDSVLLEVSKNYYDTGTTIRSYFAMDSTSITISSGTIAFTSNSISIDSDNFTLTSSGTVTATGSFTSGTDSGRKATLTSGALTFYYDGTESGKIRASSAQTWNHPDGSSDTYTKIAVESENVELSADLLDFKADQIDVLPDSGTAFSICQSGTMQVIDDIERLQADFITEIYFDDDGTMHWTTSSKYYVRTVTTKTIRFYKGLMVTSLD